MKSSAKSWLTCSSRRSRRGHHQETQRYVGAVQTSFIVKGKAPVLHQFKPIPTITASWVEDNQNFLNQQRGKERLANGTSRITLRGSGRYGCTALCSTRGSSKQSFGRICTSEPVASHFFKRTAPRTSPTCSARRTPSQRLRILQGTRYFGKRVEPDRTAQDRSFFTIAEDGAEDARGTHRAS